MIGERNGPELIHVSKAKTYILLENISVLSKERRKRIGLNGMGDVRGLKVFVLKASELRSLHLGQEVHRSGAAENAFCGVVDYPVKNDSVTAEASQRSPIASEYDFLV